MQQGEAVKALAVTTEAAACCLNMSTISVADAVQELTLVTAHMKDDTV